MANVYIAEGIVYMAASYRNQLRESGYQIQGMWVQTGILLEELDTRHLQIGMWIPQFVVDIGHNICKITKKLYTARDVSLYEFLCKVSFSRNLSRVRIPNLNSQSHQ